MKPPMGAMQAAVRARAAMAAKAARRVPAPPVVVDNRAAAKAARTVRRTVGRGAADMVGWVVSVAMAATIWCPKRPKKRTPPERLAEQVSQASQGVVVVAAAAGSVHCWFPVAVAAAVAQEVTLAAEAAAAAAAADR